MKRLFHWLCLFAVFLLMVGMVHCLAESTFGVDLSQMSFDNLLELRTSVSEEIRSRLQNSGSDMYPGTYYAGKDFPAGGYLITCTGSIGKSPPGFAIYNYDDETVYFSYVKEGDVYYFKYEDSFYIKVYDGIFSLTPYEWEL